MKPVRIQAGDRHRRVDMTVNDINEFLNILARISVTYPSDHVIISIYNEAGDELAIGLGPRFGAASFTPAGGKTVSHAVAGKTSSTKDREVAFAWYDDWAYVSRNGLLSTEVARKIAVEWIVNGALDPSVKWFPQGV